MFQKLARICLYAVPLVVVVVLPTTFFPFIGGKYFLFRLLVTLAASFTLLGWAFEEEPYSLKERFGAVLRSPVGIGFTALTAAVLLASAFAYDPHVAFWSNFERGEGSFQYLHYYLFFVLSAGLFTERRYWKTLMGTSLVAAAGVALYGTFAALSPTAFIGPYGNATGSFFARLFSSTRFQGSLGNAAYVTPYFVFIAAYVAWLWTTAKSKLKARLTAIPALLLAGLFFVLSGTRGAFLGFVAGLGVSAVYLAWRERAYRKWVIALIGIGIAVFAGLFLMRNNPHVQQLPGARFLQLDFTQLTAQTRFWTWGSAWKGFKERPVFGWGPENFPVVFDKYFDPRHFNPNQSSETWFDRAHNIVFDYLAETGAVGLLAWLSFVTLLFVQVARAIRARSLTSMQEALLVGVPVMYVVQSLVLFDVLPIFMNLAIFAALSVAAAVWFPLNLPDTKHTHVRNH